MLSIIMRIKSLCFSFIYLLVALAVNPANAQTNYNDKFLELAKDGKSVPSNLVQAYLPAIQTLDNIVKSGPAFIQMLRVLENRAKNSTKK